MHWIATSKKDTDSGALERRLRDTADQFRANSASDTGGYEHEPRRQLSAHAVEPKLATHH
jgi:hypothetical protein